MKDLIIAAICVSVLLICGTMVSFAEESVFVVSFAGEVKIIPSGKDRPVTCMPGMVLSEGTRVTTGEESYVMLAFDRSKDNLVKVKENSEVVLKLGKEDKIELIDGKMFTLLRELDKGQTFRVRTPDAVCGARGTGWGMVISGMVTTVTVFDGKVFLRGINKDGSVKEDEVSVDEGFQRKTKRYASPGKMTPVSQKRIDSMKKEFGLIADNILKMSRKKRLIDRDDELREEQMESIQQRRSEREERDAMNERRESNDNRGERNDTRSDRLENRPPPG